MRTRRLERAPVYVTAALLLGSILVGSPTHAQALVKVTPLGSHSGELCAADRALLFEDPTGVRILYDPGATTDETDPRLGEVHLILLSHAHADHIGTTRANRGGGTCAAPAAGAPNPSSNVGSIAASKGAAVFVALELNTFMGLKIQGIRGVPTPTCATSGLENETIVPMSSPCVAVFGVGGLRTVRRVGAPSGVRITGVQATHPSSIPAALIDAPGLPPGIAGYGGVAEGFVVRFTNGLTAYLTGDTGMFADMGQVIAKFYRPNLMVINLGRLGAIGADDGVNIVQYLVKPTTVLPSHVQEQATSGGVVRSDTSTASFMIRATAFTNVVLPLSDVTLAFDGEGRCIGCSR